MTMMVMASIVLRSNLEQILNKSKRQEWIAWHGVSPRVLSYQRGDSGRFERLSISILSNITAKLEDFEH